MSLSDKTILAADPTFQKRVQAAIIAASVSISTDGLVDPVSVKRHAQVVQILANTAFWTVLFSQTIAASDPTTINLATANGSVILTLQNLASQAALVTDVAINNAVSSVFNSFFGGE